MPLQMSGSSCSMIQAHAGCLGFLRHTFAVQVVTLHNDYHSRLAMLVSDSKNHFQIGHDCESFGTLYSSDSCSCSQLFECCFCGYSAARIKVCTKQMFGRGSLLTHNSQDRSYYPQADVVLQLIWKEEFYKLQPANKTDHLCLSWQYCY